VKYILDYKMEEVADLLWIGGIAAKHATEDWRTAWKHLRTACTHYLFGFDANEHKSRQAHSSLWAYAECCENAVKAGQVQCSCRFRTCMCYKLYQFPVLQSRCFFHMQAPESLLTPNLHAAVCRLLRQEIERGPAALESEWWMERCRPIHHIRTVHVSGPCCPVR
jgi:hypothetical protein